MKRRRAAGSFGILMPVMRCIQSITFIQNGCKRGQLHHTWVIVKQISFEAGEDGITYERSQLFIFFLMESAMEAPNRTSDADVTVALPNPVSWNKALNTLLWTLLHITQTGND